MLTFCHSRPNTWFVGIGICTAACLFALLGRGANDVPMHVILAKRFANAPNVFMPGTTRIGTVQVDQYGAIVDVFAANTGVVIYEPLRISGRFGSNAISPDCKTVAIATESGGIHDSVEIWDLKERKKTATIQASGRTIRIVDFAMDGKAVVTGVCDNGEVNEFSLWDAQTATRIGTLPSYHGAECSANCSADGGKYALAGNGGGLCVHDIRSQKQGHSFDRTPESAYAQPRFSADASMIAVARTRFGKETINGKELPTRSSALICIDANSGAVKMQLDDKTAGFPYAISSDNRFLFAATQRNKIRTWAIQTGAQVEEVSADPGTAVIAIRNDGRAFATYQESKGTVAIDGLPVKQEK